MADQDGRQGTKHQTQEQRATHLTGPAEAKADIMNNFTRSQATEATRTDGVRNAVPKTDSRSETTRKSEATRNR